MTDKTFKDYLKKETVQENYLKYFLGNPAMYKMFSDVDKGMTEEEFNKKYPRRKGEYAKIKKEIADMNESKQMNEDSVDMEKHDALNNIAMTLGALETEIAELARLDGDMDSSGVGDLTDQLTTMRKLVNSFEDVIDRATGVVPMESVKEDAYSEDMEANLPKIMKMKKELMDKGMKSGDAMDKACERYGFDPDDVSEYLQKKNESVNEAVDQALIDQVVDQIMRDIEMGDQTAIEELLKSCPEENLRGFLSEVEESKDLEHLKKLAGI